MKDRQPTQVLANGAIRYGVYNADGTLDHYEYLKREDAPTVEGTPLNKANLLSDATAQKLWPNADARPEDPTVSEALIELRKGSTKIGDILMTARAKPSDAWLECNGQSVPITTYPTLFSLLRTSAGPLPWQQSNIAGIDTTIQAITYANGLWIALNLSGGTLHIYSSEDFTTWETHEISVDFDSLAGYETISADVTFDQENGRYYFALLVYSGSPGPYRKVCLLSVSADLSTRINGSSFFINTYSDKEFNHVRVYFTQESSRISAMLWTDLASATVAGSRWTLEVYSTDNCESIGHGVQALYNGETVTYDAVQDILYISDLEKITKSAYYTLQTNGTLVCQLPSSITTKKAVGIDTSTGTILCVGKTETADGLYWVCSTDMGTTWSEPIKCSYGSTDSVLNSSVVANNGLILFTGTVTKGNGQTPEPVIGSFSDAITGISWSDNPTEDEETELVAGSTGLVATVQSDHTLYTCDYGIQSKPVPIIQPDTRSHAYIKALEE